jgi:ATP-dependent protease HslVU (ClpYQ) peptidase subunit
MKIRNSILACFLLVTYACEDAGTVESPATSTVSTIAGSDDSGFVDGAGTNARFNFPMGLAQDKDGNIFLADSRNNAIRKITPAGMVSTIAGGTEGSANGTGGNAQFFLPTDVVVAANGDIYVTEVYGHRIRKITPEGVVSNFAGSVDGKSGYVDGVGSDARFNAPAGITIGADGNFYVVEASNHIRKITPDGSVTTFAGSGNTARTDGTGIEASFYHPNSIEADSNGNLYVTEYEDSGIRKITNSGVVTSLNQDVRNFVTWPSAITVDKEGNCLITSNSSFSIYRLVSGNLLNSLAGNAMNRFKDGPGNEASFLELWGIYCDKSGLNIYVSDKNRIRKIVLSR